MHRVWTKKDRFFITYWCRDKQFLNVAAMVVGIYSFFQISLSAHENLSSLYPPAIPSSQPADSPKVAATGWEGTGNPSELREFFSDFVNPVPQLLSHVTSAGLWGMRDLDPLDTWVSGRAIVLGEAAHPMLPSMPFIVFVESAFPLVSPIASCR